MSPGSTPAVEAAKDQSLFREVNERLRDLNESFDAIAPDSDFVCECANRDCIEHVTMTLAEYERVRAVPTRFVVLPERRHVVPEIEAVVEERENYFVVEKTGDAGSAAVRLDPRGRR